MYEAIAANRTRSVVLIAALAALLGGIGYVLAEPIIPGDGWFGSLAGLGLAACMGLFAWSDGDRYLLRSSRAQRIEKADHPQLVNVVEEMAIASGLPRPTIYVIDDPAPNAFATGRCPETASVAVTQGLLACLDRDELQGVIAHEMGHVKNRDILFMTIASVLLGAILIISEGALRTARASIRIRCRDARATGAVWGFALLAFLVGMLAPPIAHIFYLATSRRREYLADATAALLTRLPEGLARALEKIAGFRGRLATTSRSTAPLYIVNPLAARTTSQSWIAGLFSTHPPTERRIAILRTMGTGAGYGTYEQAYRQVVGGSVLPRSALSGATALVPALVPALVSAAVAPAESGADEFGPAPSQVPSRRAPCPRPTAAHDRRQRIEDFRKARDHVRKTAGSRIVPCPCGVRLRFPGDRKRPVRCPRCRRQHDP